MTHEAAAELLDTHFIGAVGGGGFQSLAKFDELFDACLQTAESSATVPTTFEMRAYSLAIGPHKFAIKMGDQLRILEMWRN
jgi:hypothetical protein